MTKTDIYFHITPEGLETQVGTLEAEQKNNGINGVVVLDVFQSNFCSDPLQYTSQMQSWCNRFKKAVFANQQSKTFPIKEAIINIRNTFFCDMTQKQINDSNCTYKKTNPSKFLAKTVFCSRFMPLSITQYMDRLDMFFSYLNDLHLLDKVTIDLWGEPNAASFWWGTYDDFLSLTTAKIQVCRKWNLKMLSSHMTTSSLIDESYGGQYTDFIKNSIWFDSSDIGYSTSLYKICSIGEYDYNNNHFPTRKFSRIVLAECGLSASLNDKATGIIEKAKWDYFNSRMMMHYFVGLLKYSKKIGCTTVALFCLCDNYQTDNRGILAYWQHLDGGGYKQRPVWFVYRDLMTVIKTGWEETATGIRGANGKEIILTSDNYTIK